MNKYPIIQQEPEIPSAPLLTSMGEESLTGHEQRARSCCRCLRSETSTGQPMMLACRGGSSSCSTRRPASLTADSLNSPQPWSRREVGCCSATFTPKSHISCKRGHRFGTLKAEAPCSARTAWASRWSRSDDSLPPQTSQASPQPWPSLALGFT